MRKLKFHEQTLLKETNFLEYKREHGHREAIVTQRYCLVELWYRILKAKYFPRRSMWAGNNVNARSSQFWKSLQKVKYLFKSGVAHHIGNGTDTQFWNDVWLNNCPLKIEYDKLYNICANTETMISEIFKDGIWHICFNRQFGGREGELWTGLKSALEEVNLNSDRDKFVWCFENSGIFSVKSLYHHWSFGGVNLPKYSNLWGSKMPLKVKIFLWLAYQDRLQTAVQLSIRNWKGGENCLLCGVPENTDHILFNCVIAKFVWVCVKESLMWNLVPVSIDDFHRNWMKDRGGSYNHVCLFSFAAVAWELWKSRNRLAIAKEFPKHPTVIIFKIVSCLQKWSILLKEKDREALDQVISIFKIWMKDFFGAQDLRV